MSQRRRLCSYSSRKTLTAFRASPGQHLAPAARRHAGPETMIPGALDPAGLKGSLHDSFRFAVTGLRRLNPGARILVVLRSCCKTHVWESVSGWNRGLDRVRGRGKPFRLISPRHPCRDSNRVGAALGHPWHATPPTTRKGFPRPRTLAPCGSHFAGNKLSTGYAGGGWERGKIFLRGFLFGDCDDASVRL